MNDLIEFAKENRTTTFFRSKAILKIRVAYRVMEYLAPDETFPPKINQNTKDLLLMKRFSEGYRSIMHELNVEESTDLGCSSHMEALQADTMALMECLLPTYKKNCKDKREKRRVELLQELAGLESDE